jgi:hypothetical protein
MRILTIADLHCGNVAGLTPPKWNQQSEVNYKQYVYRRSLWEWYQAKIKELQPIDICVVNGDCIDGKGPKNGGTEILYQQIPTQIEMAEACIEIADAKQYRFTHGTGYHTGQDSDYEMQIAQYFGAPIEDIATVEANGLKLRFRHHIGGSQVPHGRATAILRQQLWDILWSVDGEYSHADVLIFSHVHYFTMVGNRYGTAFTTPALQGLGGSQLGSRRMGGVVDYGLMCFDVEGKDDWTWKVHLLKQTPLVRSGQAEVSQPKKSKSIFKASKKKGA